LTSCSVSAAGLSRHAHASDVAEANFDGLADGQELIVKTVKTPKRFPIPDRSATVDGSAWTPTLDLGLAAPATTLTSAVAMVGLTHPYVGQLEVDLHRVSSGANTTFPLRPPDLLNGSDNDFTSVDLLNLAGVTREDFGPGRAWALHAPDTFRFDVGQIEYVPVRVAVRTLPNRADTDGDGLNDSEELNLGSDGFATELAGSQCSHDAFNSLTNHPNGRI